MRSFDFNNHIYFGNAVALKKLKLCSLYYEKIGNDFVDDMIRILRDTVFPLQKLDEFTIKTQASKYPGDLSKLTQ